MSLTLLPVCGRAQHSALVVEQNLAELVDRAGVIVVGRVVSAKVEPHPDYKNIPTVLIAVQVDETLKGETGGLYVYRQAILDIRERYNAAGYKKGQAVLLLLASPSRYGLSAPMGLELGRFRVLEGPEGEKVVLNGLRNAGLFREMRTTLRQRGIDATAAEDAMLEQEQGALKLEEMTGLIRKLVARP